MSNPRFSEYVTSGAFALSLSRHQIARLASAANGGDTFFSSSDSSLERKGLIEQVPHPTDSEPERVEFRATLAGLICMGLLHEAGLSNYGDNAVADELAALRIEIAQSRTEAVESRARTWSALARKEKIEQELETACLEIKRLCAILDAADAGIKFRDLRPVESERRVMRRDKRPHLSDAELRGDDPSPAFEAEKHP